MNRIQKVAITAMKQTLNAYLPKINSIDQQLVSTKAVLSTEN